MINLIWEFDYDGERRIVVVTSDKKGVPRILGGNGERTITGWDFTADGFRTFKFNKIENLRLVTEFKIFEDNEELADRYENKGASVFHHSDAGVMYVVRLQDGN